MAAILQAVVRESGWTSIHAAGHNAYIIILSRMLRMFAHGAVTLVLAPFLANLEIADHYIGLFMTLTLLGDVFLGMYLTLIADRFGRRRVLLVGSCMMILTGLAFALSESYWVLLLTAVVGVVSVTGTDFGPFRSIEESINSQLTSTKTRADVFTWYISLGLGGSAMGSEAAGRVVERLKGLQGWSVDNAYRVVFGVYAIVGLVNVVLVLCLSEACEMKADITEYTPLDQEVAESIELMSNDVLPEQVHGKQKSKWSWSKSFSTISPPTLSIVYKLWILLAVDSMAEGMAPYALTVYYMDQKFHPAKSTLGDVTSVAYFLSATLSIFAGSLARRFGLVNTMVFSHAPSSAAVLLYSLPDSLALAVILIFIRIGLQNVDQAPRGAFIAAVCRHEERTAVLGIAGMLRTIAAMPGPFLTGMLADSGLFGYGFAIAGAIRLAYDAGLYVTYSGLEPPGGEDK